MLVVTCLGKKRDWRVGLERCGDACHEGNSAWRSPGASADLSRPHGAAAALANAPGWRLGNHPLYPA